MTPKTQPALAQVAQAKNPVTGIIHVTGEAGTGKTTFALGCGFSPERMAFINKDPRNEEILKEIIDSGHKFAHYFDFNEMLQGKKEYTQWEIIDKCISMIKPGDVDVIIYDTYSHIEALFHPIVKKEGRSKFRDNWAQQGAIAGAQEHQVAQELESAFMYRLRTLAPLVILVTQVKDDTNASGKIVGRQVPILKRTAIQNCRLRLWLKFNPEGPEPIGVVLKNMDRKTVTNEGIVPTAILPYRLVPGTWEKLLYYWHNPVGKRPLTDEEKCSEAEMALITGGLTKDQQYAYALAAASQGAEIATEDLPADFPQLAPTPVDGKEAQEMLDKGTSPVDVASHFAKALGISVNVGDVFRATTDYKSKNGTG